MIVMQFVYPDIAVQMCLLPRFSRLFLYLQHCEVDLIVEVISQSKVESHGSGPTYKICFYMKYIFSVTLG